MKKISFILPMLFALAACGGGQKAGAVKELRLAHTLPQAHPIHQAYLQFADMVATNSKGKYKVTVYADAQLGDQRSAMQLAQSGGLEFVHMNIAILEGFDPTFSLLTLPYIFKNYEHYKKVMDDPKIRDMYALLLPKGFLPLTYLEGGSRSFYNKSRAIKTPADMKGLKIRVQESPIQIEMIKRFGGSPVAMVPSEIYTALQQGVIDGAENNYPTYTSQKHLEVAKYWSASDHSRLSDILSISGPFWQNLSDEDKKMFIDTAVETTKVFAKMWADGEAASLKEMQAAGTKFNDVDQNAFRNLVLSMHDEYGAKNAENKKWLDFVRSLE